MSAIRSLFRELKDAGLKGIASLDQKLAQLTDKLDEHFGTVIREFRDQDRFDGPGGSGGPGSHGPAPHPYQPNPHRKPDSMSDEEYLDLLEASVHNPSGLAAVLGKFYKPGTASYIDVAEGMHPPATYFSLGNEWGSIANAHDLTDKDMFDAFNVPFLERMMAEGKPIHFSHNPLDFPGTALADELEFLERHGYRFDPATMQAIQRHVF